MSNIIKCRAFWKGKMYRVLQIDYREPNTVALTDEKIDHFNVPIDEVVLMPFTGMYDKNNKEIYVGDVIQVPNDYNEYGMAAGEKYEVYFAYGGFRMKPKIRPNARGFYIEDDRVFEVLGNIYENPNLLGGKP